MSLLGPIGELWESWDMPNNISHPQPAYNLPLPLLQAPAYRHNTSLTQIPDPWKERRQRGRSVYTDFWLLCLFLSEKQWVEMKGIAHIISPGQIFSEVPPSSTMYPNHPHLTPKPGNCETHFVKAHEVDLATHVDSLRRDTENLLLLQPLLGVHIAYGQGSREHRRNGGREEDQRHGCGFSRRHLERRKG